jgi:hypothetical protein
MRTSFGDLLGNYTLRRTLLRTLHIRTFYVYSKSGTSKIRNIAISTRAAVELLFNKATLVLTS